MCKYYNIHTWVAMIDDVPICVLPIFIYFRTPLDFNRDMSQQPGHPKNVDMLIMVTC